MGYLTVERLILAGGEAPGKTNVEAHILSSKNQTKTTAIVMLTIDVSDNPTLQDIEKRIVVAASRNLSPD